MTRPKKRDLKETVERELVEMFRSDKEPSEGRMKLLKTAIGFLAVNAKLEESEYGGFFGADDTPGIPVKPGQKPPLGKREAGAGDEGDSGDEGSSFFAEGTRGLPQ